MSYPPPLGYSYSSPSSSNLSAPQLLLSQGTSPTLSPTTPTTTNSPLPCVESRPLTSDPVTSPTNQSVYTSGLLNYPAARMPGLTETMSTLYNTAYASQGYVPFGADPSAFYSPLAPGNNTDAWRNLSQGGAWPYDPTMAAYPYSTGYGGLDVRRKNATREATSTLKAWLYEHIKNPYPTKGEKIMLAIITKMTLTQVSTWFANARRRLKKENKMQWSPRNRSGEDDDDDKDSDVEGDNREDGKGDNGGSRGSAQADDKDEDDEDIIVDGCGANDSFQLLSPGDKSEDGSLLDLRDTSNCLDMGAIGQGNAPQSSFSTSTPPVEPNHITNSYLHTSNLSDPKDHLHFAATSAQQHPQQHQLSHQHNQQHPHLPHPLHPKDSVTVQNSSSQSSKPRIWSMADMATPSQPQLDIRRSPTAIAQSLISKSGYTAFTSPTSQPHPALNGSYHGLASPPNAATTGLSPYRLSNYMAAGGGSAASGTLVPCSSVAPGILPNFHRPTSINVLAAAAAAPSPCSQRITPGVLGSSLDGSRMGSLSANPLSNTATAFKPVPRRS